MTPLALYLLQLYFVIYAFPKSSSDNPENVPHMICSIFGWKTNKQLEQQWSKVFQSNKIQVQPLTETATGVTGVLWVTNCLSASLLTS